MQNELLIELVFPIERKKLYNRIQLLFSKYGEEALKDCNATCSEHNKNVVTCWNLFIAATAAYNLGEIKKANVIWNHCEAQLALIYRDVDIYPEEDVEYHNWIFTLNEGESITDYINDDNKYDYNLKGSLLNVQFKNNSKLVIITKDPSLGVLDYSMVCPLVRSIQPVFGEEYYKYESVNTYDSGVHRLKFITQIY